MPVIAQVSETVTVAEDTVDVSARADDDERIANDKDVRVNKEIVHIYNIYDIELVLVAFMLHTIIYIIIIACKIKHCQEKLFHAGLYPVARLHHILLVVVATSNCCSNA